MKTSICFYFQVHQPFRLRKNYSFFCIGTDHFYEDHEVNQAIMQKVANNCYLPANRMMLDLIKKHQGKFRISYSISGLALEQFELYAPEVLDSFKELVKTGCVEIINETFYHSLAILKSEEEFKEQILLHRQKIKDLFDVTPTTFRNTELIYNNHLAKIVEDLGYDVILAEGTERVLHWRSPNFVYIPYTCEKLKVLFKNYKLSDDIAFRFSNRGWSEYPLTVDKYLTWIDQIAQRQGEVINLFMDYETFGEHQWKDSGIFDFMEKLPGKILENPDYNFLTPKEVAQTYEAMETVDVHNFTSWADSNRDLSAWVGNPLQDSALDLAYSLEEQVKKIGDPELLHTWRKLLCSDHNYYACTKWSNDGDVHNYFNPYDTPYDAFLVYANVLSDFRLTLRDRGAPTVINENLIKQ
ncbi:MAG: glycoside hydrolase family 57 protein [Pseudomonadota bacterium]